MFLGGGFCDDVVDAFGFLWSDDYCGVVFDDSCFFGGDVFEGVAEPLHVVHVDWSDDGDVGSEDVGGVPASSHAYFHNGDVDWCVCEGADGHGGEYFEETHFCAVDGCKMLVGEVDIVFDLFVGVNEGVVGDAFTVDADAFVNFFEVW